MYDLLETKFFSLLADTSQEVTNEEMQNAYGKFIEQIRMVSNGNDYSTTYRILVATRAGGKMRLKNCSYKRHWRLLTQNRNY